MERSETLLDNGEAGRRKLKLVLRQKRKLNASTSGRSRKLNTSHNVSMMKQTLENNRALAKALTKCKEELNQAHKALLKEKEEKQHLHEQLYKLQKLANLKNDEIEQEIVRRMHANTKNEEVDHVKRHVQVAIEKMYTVLSGLGSMCDEAMSVTTDFVGIEEKENNSDPKIPQTNGFPLKRRMLNREPARVPVSNQTEAPPDLSLIVEKSVLDELNNMSWYSENKSAPMSTVTEDEESNSRRTSRQSGRRSGLIDRVSIARALSDRVSASSDTGNNKKRSGSLQQAEDDNREAAAFQKSKKIRYSNISYEDLPVPTIANRNTTTDDRKMSEEITKKSLPIVDPDERPIPTLVNKKKSADNPSPNEPIDVEERPFAYTFIPCTPPRTSAEKTSAGKRLSRKKSKSGNNGRELSTGNSLTIPSIVNDSEKGKQPKRRTYSLSPQKSSLDKTVLTNSPMDMTESLSVQIVLPNDEVDLIENEVMPDLDLDIDHQKAPSNGDNDNQIEKRQLSVITHESRLKPPSVKVRRAAAALPVNESGKIEMNAMNRQKLESSGSASSSDESTSKLKQFHTNVKKPGKFEFKAGRRDFSKPGSAQLTIGAKKMKKSKPKAKPKTVKLDQPPKVDEKFGVFEMSLSDSTGRSPLMSLNEYRGREKNRNKNQDEAPPGVNETDYHMSDETIVKTVQQTDSEIVTIDMCQTETNSKQTALNRTYDKDDELLKNGEEEGHKGNEDAKEGKESEKAKALAEKLNERIEKVGAKQKGVQKKKVSTRTKVICKRVKHDEENLDGYEKNSVVDVQKVTDQLVPSSGELVKQSQAVDGEVTDEKRKQTEEPRENEMDVDENLNEGIQNKDTSRDGQMKARKSAIRTDEDETENLLKRIEGSTIGSQNEGEAAEQSNRRKTRTKAKKPIVSDEESEDLKHRRKNKSKKVVDSDEEFEDSPIVQQRKRHLTNRRALVSDDEEDQTTSSRQQTADGATEQNTRGRRQNEDGVSEQTTKGKRQTVDGTTEQMSSRRQTADGATDQTTKGRRQKEDGATDQTSQGKRETEDGTTEQSTKGRRQNEDGVTEQTISKQIAAEDRQQTADGATEKTTSSRRLTADGTTEHEFADDIPEPTPIAKNSKKKSTKLTTQKKRANKKKLVDDSDVEKAVSEEDFMTNSRKSTKSKKGTTRRTTKVKKELDVNDYNENEDIEQVIQYDEHDDGEPSEKLSRKSSVVSLDGSDDGGTDSKRSRRTRTKVSYKELSLGVKLRQGDKCFGIAGAKKK